MSADSSLLDQCFARILRETPLLLGRCIDAAVSSLQQAENQGREVMERERMARAWWNLQQQRGVLTAHYPGRLEQAFRLGSEEGNTSALSRLSDSSLLELVDDSAINESLEAARLLQALMPAVEQELAMVDARMSSLIGLETVHAEKNPIRPSVFVRALRDLMSERETDIQVRTLWLQHVAPPLARELSQLYEQVALMLQRANVLEASYRIRLVADSPSSSRMAPLSSGGRLEDGAGVTSWGSEGSLHERPELPPMSLRMGDLAREQTPLQHEVMRAFLSDEDGVFDARLDNSYYEQVRRELARVDAQAALPQLDEVVIERELNRYRDLPVVERPARLVNAGSQLSTERWGTYAAPHERSRVLLELKHQADKVSQAVGLDVVRKLVNQVARDPLLLAPVREAVVALEPALLRLAMAQPRYFSQDEHPARRLIENVAQRSFRYNDEFSPEFEAFFEPLREKVATLNAAASADAAPFAQALSDLQAQWQGADAEEETRKQRQLDALRFAEARQELADQIAWEISHRPDIYNVPGIVLDFLYGSWSLVIASAQLTHADQGPDPFGFRKVISHLLWSTRREVTLRQPRQLFEIVPGMLQTLRKGLDMLGKSPEETQTFFDALLKLHEPVLKLRRLKARTDHATSGSMPLEIGGESEVPDPALDVATPEQQKPRPPEQPWIGERELASAGFVEALPSGHGELGAGDAGAGAGGTAVAQQDGVPADELAALLASLHVGGWVDLFSDGRWLRAQLVWASTKGSLFMFTSRGGRAHTMTRRVCEKLLTQRWLRPVATRPVVPQALRAMAEQPPEDVQAREPVSA
ncbi:MAG: DUF1631 family protein [Hydrogenophaga sp.]|jgi:hypothetical protein|uniref:DUF1631 family protein n=1 Tax=Hydrogenophaga sp. TaxID=1904254 RepID=UPI00262E71D4|nr:DUF1631 family protein [Hydrogenophaga sp.]MDD3784731.1 DUF1631 family protein [Hydrogenophaga sp.]MDX9968337.1 DUF1631 family protein [Hydrogenophaga sp.]